jgi:Rps23 Pro-64 3,4-dihydroxylase Tpa1-like proline 4-hydroxylase
VLGLTPGWRAEWGGLLMFHERGGDIERALMPRFNVLNVFAVPQLHSVSAVAPFAGNDRLSVTGWLRFGRPS